MTNHVPFVYFSRSVDGQGLNTMRLLVDLTLAFEGCSFFGNLISHLGFDIRWLLHDLRTKYGLLLSNCTN